MVAFEYPLQWPAQQPRTKRPERARFGDHSVSKAGDYLIAELERMGAKKFVISSNLQRRVRGDGFLANQRVDDPGVVVYFEMKGKSKAMACDAWDRPEHNLWALHLSVSAIRGVERWSGSGFLDALYSGFQALPSPDDIVNAAPQYFGGMSPAERKQRYRELVKELHPDVGGDAALFAEMRRQYEQLEEV